MTTEKNTQQTQQVQVNQTAEIAAEVQRSGVHYLSGAEMETLTSIAMEAATGRGKDFYGWKNAPEYKDGTFTQTSGWGDSVQTREVSPVEALEIYRQKLDGAYGERFLLSLAAVAGYVEKGHRVALLQLQDEPGVPFNANGWVVMSVNGYPMFHISPQDLPMEKVAEAGLISLVEKDSDSAKEHGWKGTDKIEEFGMLLRWATAPRQD